MLAIVKPLLLLLAFLGVVSLASPVALAQVPPTRLSLTRGSADAVELRPLQVAALDPALYRKPRRARFLIAAGIGMLVASAVHVGWAYPNRMCRVDTELKASLYGAAIVGGVGVSLAIGGGTWLALSPSRHSYRATRGQIVAASALALGAALGAQALLFVTYAFDGVSCSS